MVRFPDAPTQRGVKHLRELVECRMQGYDAYGVIFVVQMKDVTLFLPNEATDPDFAQALRQAKESGVKIVAVDCLVTESRIEKLQQIGCRCFFEKPNCRLTNGHKSLILILYKNSRNRGRGYAARIAAKISTASRTHPVNGKCSCGVFPWVDSSLLLAVAQKILGNKVIALTERSCVFPSGNGKKPPTLPKSWGFFTRSLTWIFCRCPV